VTYLFLFAGLSIGTLLGWMLCAVLVKSRIADSASERHAVDRLHDMQSARSSDHGAA